MAWIDNKNTDDMVPQSWLKDYHQIYKVDNKVIKFIEETMKS